MSFAARRGETLALLGESGCGKSMTATALVGLLEPVADVVGGTAMLGDASTSSSANRKKRREMAGTELAIVFQDALTALNPLYTVGTQLAEPFRIHQGMSAKDAKGKAVELMARVGIPQPETRLNSYPHQFSGGMRQRLLIAMAVALNPSVLIADEPTTALDVTVQAQIMALLRDLRAEYDMAVVLITHDLALVAEEADRVAVMYAGQHRRDRTGRRGFRQPQAPLHQGPARLGARQRRPRRHLKSIGGSPPDLHSIPNGCVYQDRCPLARDICATTRPALRHVGTAGAGLRAIPEEVHPTLSEYREPARGPRPHASRSACPQPARTSCARSTASTSTWRAARRSAWSANPAAASPLWPGH